MIAAPCWGTVIAVQANYYQVALDAPPPCPQLLCTRRSRLKKIGQQVMVGDRVVVEEANWEAGRGAIAAVAPRQTVLDRPPMANGDQILLLFALANPPLDPWQVSRFLVKAEATGMGICVGLNKADLVEEEEQQTWRSRLTAWGYEAILLSARQGWGIAELHQRLQKHTTLVAGPSGVGKSSIINRLIPHLNLSTQQVSGKLQRGRHTTRHVALFSLPGGGLLADSPGFNQPDLVCEPQQLVHYFPEARQRLQDLPCQFHNCLHRHEPNCQVQGDWERYSYYLTFLEEAIARQGQHQRQGDREAGLKTKIGEAGQVHYEPKLATKTYRRPSRREKRQDLQRHYQQQSVTEILQQEQGEEDRK